MKGKYELSWVKGLWTFKNYLFLQQTDKDEKC